MYHFIDMAYIWKKPNSRYWQAGFIDQHAKRRNASTGIEHYERNRSKALRIADEYEAVARRKKGALQVKETLSQLLKETGLSVEEELVSCTVREYCDRFLEHKKPDVGASSLSSYKKSFENLCDWLEKKADSPIEVVTPAMLKDFRLHIIDSYAEKTATRKLKAVKAMFTECHSEGYSLVNPATRLEVAVKSSNKAGQQVKRPFTLEEMKALIEASSGEWRSMIYFGLYTGQRLGDLATLRWSNLNLRDKLFTIYTNKTGRKIDIPFSDTLLDHILTLDAPDDPEALVHPILGQSYEARGASSLSNQFSDLLASIGLKQKVSHKSKGVGREGKRVAEGVGFHNLRVTAITLLHEAGIPQATVQGWVGHESEDVHRLYIKLGKEASQKASDALPKI